MISNKIKEQEFKQHITKQSVTGAFGVRTMLGGNQLPKVNIRSNYWVNPPSLYTPCTQLAAP